MMPTTKRRSQICKDWQPSDKDRAYALKKFPQYPIDEQAEAFRNYHQARGSLMASWPAAWRTWVGNFTKFGGKVNGNGAALTYQQVKSMSTRDVLAKAAELKVSTRGKTEQRLINDILAASERD